MKLFTSKFTITEWFDTHHLPTFYVIKTVYFFNFALYAQVYGRDGKDLPFLELKDAENYKQMLIDSQNSGK